MQPETDDKTFWHLRKSLDYNWTTPLWHKRRKEAKRRARHIAKHNLKKELNDNTL